MGEKDVGVYQAVEFASWLCGALGKIHDRWGSLLADWNWCAMSARCQLDAHILDFTLILLIQVDRSWGRME